MQTAEFVHNTSCKFQTVIYIYLFKYISADNNNKKEKCIFIFKKYILHLKRIPGYFLFN